jgi:protein-S-isoprenylcysteine O-methyltransferase
MMLILLFAAIFAGIYFSKNYYVALPGTRDEQMALGILMMWLGIAIRAWAIRNLGKFFTTVVTIQQGHKVIRAGPYRYVRHPSYSGSFLAFIGAGIALGNALGLVSMAILTYTAYYVRMNIEEQALITAFGEEYVKYMKETKRMVPFLY